jgi:hypothetical protein
MAHAPASARALVDVRNYAAATCEKQLHLRLRVSYDDPGHTPIILLQPADLR